MNIQKPPFRIRCFVYPPSRRSLTLLLGCFAAFLHPGATEAGLISAVTEGPANAPYFYNLTVQFSNGNYYDFSLRSTLSTISGEVLLNTVASNTPGMSVQQHVYSFGDAVDAITIGTDTGSGFGNSFWNYWHGTATPSVQWAYADDGETGRMLTSGQADAWVFGEYMASSPQATAFPIPAPEPGTWTLVGLSMVGGLLLTSRARHGRGPSPASV